MLPGGIAFTGPACPQTKIAIIEESPRSAAMLLSLSKAGDVSGIHDAVRVPRHFCNSQHVLTGSVK